MSDETRDYEGRAIFGVYYTDDGTRNGKALGFQVIRRETNESAGVICHNDLGDDDTHVRMLASVAYMLGKYNCDYASVPDLVRKGPMPPHPDSVSKKGKRRVILELAIEVNPDADLADVEDSLYNALQCSDLCLRTLEKQYGLEIQGLTGPRP